VKGRRKNLCGEVSFVKRRGGKWVFLHGVVLFFVYMLFFVLTSAPPPGLIQKKREKKGSLPQPPPKEGVGFTGWNGCFFIWVLFLNYFFLS